MKEKKEKKWYEDLLNHVDKMFGSGSMMCLGDQQEKQIESISTGSIGLNSAIGTGGYPVGRLIEIFGNESSGKTTLCLHAIAEAQKQGHRCAFIDAENSLDMLYAKNLGVDIDNLLVSQPDCGEEALGITETIIRDGRIKLVVIDSVAALVPRAEVEGTMEDSQIGLQARMMSKAMRKLTAIANKNKATVIFINQIRSKIGITYGSNKTTSGGNALKFYASVRLEIKKISLIKEGTDITGVRTVAKVVKNKVSTPFREAIFDIVYGTGINSIGEIVDIAVEQGIINKNGSWFNFGELKLGQGRNNVLKLLCEKQEVLNSVKSKLNPKFIG